MNTSRLGGASGTLTPVSSVVGYCFGRDWVRTTSKK